MRREYISYNAEVPVNVSFVNIKDYPIHWHESTEIVYVLKGTLEIYINSNKYELHEGEIEIINIDEVHHLESSDSDNKVLIFQMDPYFFEKYYSDIKNMYFYTNTSTPHVQVTEEYDELRTYLSIILYEITQREEGYDEEIKRILVELLYHLINNFNYLIYEKEELKEDRDLFKRYHSISKYIFNNYKSNITLQDIAEKEFLSPQYLSHEIKYATGYSFTDLLNLTRVEESIKLLIDTDKTITEISDEVGFSHTRYYNKNFKLYYKSTPMQFRKKYKISDDKLNEMKRLQILDLNKSVPYLTSYLEDYERFNYKDRIVKINIDVNNSIGTFIKSFKNILTIGDAFDLLIEDNKNALEELQAEIGFEYGRIFNVFSADMVVFPESKFLNWNRNKDVLEFLYSIDVKPLIVIDVSGFTDDNFIEVFKSFLSYFSDLDSLDFAALKFEFDVSLSESLKEKITKLLQEYYNVETINLYPLSKTAEINTIYDTAYMIPFIIHNLVFNDNPLSFLRAFDVLDKQINLTNEVFLGYPGLINDKGIKKPSYYAYYLLNKLGDTLVAKENGYIITKTYDEYQILLYNFHEDIDKLITFRDFFKQRGLKNVTSEKISLNITNIQSDIRITRYEINEGSGSSFNYWLQMGSPIRLSKEEKEILFKASFPEVKFKYFKRSAVVNIQAELKGYGAILILIKKVQKHQ